MIIKMLRLLVNNYKQATKLDTIQIKSVYSSMSWVNLHDHWNEICGLHMMWPQQLGNSHTMDV